MKFISPFISQELSCETEHSLSSSLKPEPCPSGPQNVVLDSGRVSTLILHDMSLEKENRCAMDNIEAPTLETEKKNFAVEHQSFSFETPHASCSLLEFPKWISLSTTCFHEDHNHISILVCKLFRRMVVDALIYHKYCKSYIFIVALTL